MPLQNRNRRQGPRRRQPRQQQQQYTSTTALTARESLVVAMSMPQTVRRRALQSFVTTMSMNEASLQQATAFTHYETGFSIALMNGSADYTAVFDQYRIRKVEMILRCAITDGAGGANFSAPTIYSVIDYDDSNPITTASGFREYANCTLSQYESVRRTFTPSMAIGAYNTGGALTGYSNVFAPWCDVGSVNVEHHGIKVGMDGGSGVIPQVLHINFTFEVEWRCTR